MSHVGIYQDVTNSIVAHLEQGTIAWRKPWSSGGAPKNLISGRTYQGLNIFLLAIMPFSSPYWLSFKQAQERGGYVCKGERGTKIIFWRMLKKECEENGSTVIKNYPYLNSWMVFNVEQCAGIETPTVAQRIFTPIEEAEKIVANMPKKPAIFDNGGDKAFYVPALDEVHLPKREYFHSTEVYYSTLFHELGHSTGHKNRLARAEIVNAHEFGSEPYSREELVAEMTAAMLCGVTGITLATLTNSAAYIGGWLQALNKDKKLIITVAGHAQKAADFIRNIQMQTEDAHDSFESSML